MGMSYKPPSASELRAIARSAGVAEAVEDHAEKGAQHAASIAPVDTGAYRSRFRVETDSSTGEAAIVNDDPGAAAIEFGTDDTPAHHVLSQTADYLEKG